MLSALARASASVLFRQVLPKTPGLKPFHLNPHPHPAQAEEVLVGTVRTKTLTTIKIRLRIPNSPEIAVANQTKRPPTEAASICNLAVPSHHIESF
jgi:hypothetical protein